MDLRVSYSGGIQRQTTVAQSRSLQCLPLSVDVSAGPVISAINLGPSVMAKHHVRIVSVGVPNDDTAQIPNANDIAEFGLTCEYARERKKRGKASRRDLAAQQAASSTGRGDGPTSPNGQSSDDSSPVQGSRQTQDQSSIDAMASSDHSTMQSASSRSRSLTHPTPHGQDLSSAGGVHRTGSLGSGQHRTGSLGSGQHLPNSTVTNGQGMQNLASSATSHPQNAGGMGLEGFDSLHDIDRSTMQMNGMTGLHMMPTPNQSHHLPTGILPSQNFQSFPDHSYPLMSPTAQHSHMNGFRFATGESPTAGFMSLSPAGGSPGWFSLPSPASGTYQGHILPSSSNTLRYPVLQPLMPHVGNIIPQTLACELLEQYFTSSSSAHMRPQSPYLLGYIFRKKSFLHPSRPRSCSPALLASMLWIAAQTSDAAFLTSPPSARGRVCQKLLELTVGLLKPLIHGPASGEGSPNYPANMVINGVALGGFGVSMDQVGSESGATGALDDVATYIHLATVVSASEYKAASMRWWNAAWSLARELKLGRELPPNPPQGGQMHGEDADADGDVDLDMQAQHAQVGHVGRMIGNDSQSTPGPVTEEEREERRRIWWLLYTMDRHLALCYNRPVFFLDKECDGLLQPMNDNLWQAGDFYTGDANMYNSNPSNPRYRRRGLCFECTGHSIFGYFLPLMTILGEIVDLNHARNHPRFGLTFRNGTEWDEQEQEIANQLEAYGQSLRELEARFAANLNSNADANENGPDQPHNDITTPSVHSVSTNSSRMTESIMQTKIVLAYGTHIMHVLHILLTGRWDPISLLDDNDLWISSQSFITATGHAVSAAEALSDILEYDPDLSFMPFFFGVYLLQGSFLLLLIADKLQGDASPSVVKACETIVRAHEACVVTLNTEYQVCLPIPSKFPFFVRISS